MDFGHSLDTQTQSQDTTQANNKIPATTKFSIFTDRVSKCERDWNRLIRIVMVNYKANKDGRLIAQTIGDFLPIKWK